MITITGDALFFHFINLVESLEERVDDVVACIKNNKFLEHVCVNEPLAIEDERKRKRIYQAILRNSHIQALHIQYRLGPFSKEIAVFLAQMLREMKNLGSLEVWSARFDTMETAAIFSRALQANRTLGRLCFTNLSMELSTMFLQSVARSLRFRSPLKTLSVWNCKFSEEALVALEKALGQQYSSLTSFGQKLSVRDTDEYPVNTIPRIMIALITSKTVTSVDLSFPSAGIEQETGAAASRLLRENHTLQDFTATMNGDNQAIAVDSLTQSIAVSSSLKKVSLSGWGIDDRGIQSLCNAAIGIESFCLARNNFGVVGVEAIRDMLSRRTALRSLDLSGNLINDAMLSTLCMPLAGDHPLEELWLGQNRIGDEGCFHIGQALRENTGLLKLRLENNAGITDSGVRALIEGVKVHPKITSIWLHRAECSPLVARELGYHLELNKGARGLLRASPPLGLWPHAFKRFSTGRKVFDRSMLYYLIKEKADLFAGVPVLRKRKRRHGQ